MDIDKSLVSHLANLSRLQFSEEEVKAMQVDLTKMIGFVEKLNELDTTGVEPLMHMSTAFGVFREDEVSELLNVDRALQNAEKHATPFFNVPKVLS